MEAALLVVHITAGSLALPAGYIAIFAAKGAGLHRRSGVMSQCDHRTQQTI